MRTKQHKSPIGPHAPAELHGHEPVVGVLYWARVVTLGDGTEMPIIGGAHEDSDLKVEQAHWHYDTRFFRKRHVLRARYSRDLDVQMCMARVVHAENHPPSYRLLRCVRVMPDFPLAYNGDSRIVRTLEPKYKDARVSCMVCPHRGMDLSGLPVKDGMVVCNGHGLRWRLADGKMVPRLTRDGVVP